jgi:peptidoglycan/xylan/chitin deacetylase (PgdA/CDA1 family)
MRIGDRLMEEPEMKTGATTWPNGSKIAVALTVMFETWPEGKWPPYAAQRWQPKPGALDHQSISFAQYGGKAGIWRILNILDKAGMPATFCTNAHSVEVYPEAAAQVVKCGHDFAAHGYTQDAHLADMTAEQEQATIRRCIEVLEKNTGQRPQGWLSPILAWTAHTDDFLAQEKMLWHGDANYTDLPRRVHTPHGTIAHVPHSDYTDNRVLWLSPQDYFNVYKDTFDYLYANEPLSLMVMTLHCHFGGRPLMSAQMHKLLRYFSSFPGVWFARHRELAQWALEGDADEISNAQRFFPQ